MQGNAKRTKFVILGQSRSGTQLLRTLLNSHSQIHCDGELLHLNLQYVNSRPMLEFFRLYPDPLLQSRLNAASDPVYGFNLMFYHLRLPRFTLKRLLRSGWLLIHVLRRDLLQISFSYLIAERTGTWHRREGEDRPDYSVTITPAELEKELTKRIRWRRQELERVRGLPLQAVSYEQDLADSSRWQAACDRIFAALSIESQSVGSPLTRTDARPSNEIIANYGELTAWLADSPLYGTLAALDGLGSRQ